MCSTWTAPCWLVMRVIAIGGDLVRVGGTNWALKLLRNRPVSIKFEHRNPVYPLPHLAGEIHNAAAEAFFATLKRELAWIQHTERRTTEDQLRSVLLDYIEDSYNLRRIQRRLGHRSGK